MVNKKGENTDNMKGRAAAGVAGAVIGAGVAVAAGKMLSDKKNQEKLKKTLHTVQKQVKSGVKSLQEKAAMMQKDAQKNKSKVQQDAKKIIAKAESAQPSTAAQK